MIECWRFICADTVIHVSVQKIYLNLPLFAVDFPGPAEVGAETALVLFSAMILFLGTGELLPEGVALFPGPSSQESVDEPDSSSEDKVGG